MTANEKQVGGDHYVALGRWQHWDMMSELYGYGWFLGNVTKYICRHGNKDKGTEGLEKAVHYLEKAQEVSDQISDFWDLQRDTGEAFQVRMVQKLVEVYGITNSDLRAAVKYTVLARNNTDLAEAARYLRDFIAEAENVGRVPGSATFTPPPIAGYKTLRGDQVNLINEFKALGTQLEAKLESVIDMYTAEDVEDAAAMKTIQEDFNKKVHDLIAATPPKEGETEDEVWTRRQPELNKLEEEAKPLLAVFNAPAEARHAGARWLNLARTHLQQGLMAAVRAITRPDGF